MQRVAVSHSWNSVAPVHVCTPMDDSPKPATLFGSPPSGPRTPARDSGASDPPRDGVELDAVARRFDNAMDRARTRLAAMNRAADELADLAGGGGPPQHDAEPDHRRRLLGDLAAKLGGARIPGAERPLS
jgi:hypothetical protein